MLHNFFPLLTSTAYAFSLHHQQSRLNQSLLHSAPTDTACDCSNDRIPQTNLFSYPQNISICIIGRVEKAAEAERYFLEFGQTLPSYFYASKESNTENVSNHNLLTIHTSGDLSFVDSLLALIRRAQQYHACDYFLVLNDFGFPVKFSGAPYSNVADFDAPAKLLSKTLKKYFPAVALYTRKKQDYLKLASEEPKFDSRAVVFHYSIIELFITTAFTSLKECNIDEATERKCYSKFLYTFAPSVFRESTIKIETINLGPDGEEGLRSSMYNKNLDSFFESGFLHLNRKFEDALGADYLLNMPMEHADRGRDWFLRNQSLIFDRLANMYSLKHPLIAQNSWLQLHLSKHSNYILDNTQIRIIFHIFTSFSRNRIFDKLFASINCAKKAKNSKITTIIHVDEFSSKQDTKRSLKYFKSLYSKHGDLRFELNSLRVNESSRIFARDLTNMWFPTDKREYSVFLDACVTEVSPNFFEFIEHAVKKYLNALDFNHDRSIMGVALHPLIWDPVNGVRWNPLTKSPYLLQHPQPLGMILSPTPWVEFVKWKMQHVLWKDPLIPDSKTNVWPSSSWLKYLLRFMTEDGKTILYPYFPTGLLRVNGTSIPPTLKAVASTGPLLALKEGMANMRNFSDFLEGNEFSTCRLPSYDAYFSSSFVQPNLALGSNVTKFDTCTMVMQVYTRASTILDRLTYYQTLPYLSSIIIVWNNMDKLPPLINHPESPIFHPAAPTFLIPIHILKQHHNSMNNRFLPFPHLSKTSCVVAMDDDWDFSHAKLVRAIRAWQRSGYTQLVGFQQQGRIHVKKHVGRKTLKDLKVKGLKTDNAGIAQHAVEIVWGYGKVTKNSISILMPSATVYHAKYHEMYTYSLPENARAVVEELTNCDDILFNMMVANATGLGPVVLDDGLKLEKAILFEGDGKGLWKDNEHWAKRVWCMNYFVDSVFGGVMPLKSTRVFQRLNTKNKK